MASLCTSGPPSSSSSGSRTPREGASHRRGGRTRSHAQSCLREQVVLPPGIDGQALLGLSARGLSDLVETDHAAGRNDGEGWYVSSQARVGRALFSALREAQSRFPMRR
mmetsp:Transcript_18682/g.39580  ORF Transcript_18682/g.39580 Transcript_18682/m.39580 type:complete len:109 (-) Transcript_18682:952-1278(-)